MLKIPKDGVNCCAYNCMNTTVNKPDYTFFSIPQKDPKRRNLWLRQIGRDDLIDKPIQSRTRRVCEEHFTPDCILYTKNRRMLKRTAVPSLKLPDQATNQEIVDLDPAPTTSTANVDSFSIITQTENKDGAETTDSNISIETSNKEMDDFLENLDDKAFHRLCEKHLPEEFVKLIKGNHNLKCKSTYNYQEYKNFCITLYQTSPQAYYYLRSIFCILSPTLIVKRYLRIGTEVNDKFLITLKPRVDNMTAMERNCSVLIDSMSLKASLCYNIKEDTIIGFQEVDGVRSLEPTTRALVVMIRGITSNWKLPISYALVSERINEDEISNWMHNLLKSLFEIGLNVRSLISAVEDVSINYARSVSVANPYFFINDRKVYRLFDASDLIISARDSMVSNDFHFEDNIVKYAYFVKFYDEDQKRTLPIAGKLTSSHINPTSNEKREVKYAAQLFSRTVANGLGNYIAFKRIEETGIGTVEFIIKLNDLFDMLNASENERRNESNENKRAFRGEEIKRKFFEEMLHFFQNLNVINSKSGEDVTSTTKFIKGFSITIKGILLLFDNLKEEGQSFLPTKNLQLQVLKTFFKQITTTKNGTLTKPTPLQFISAFRKRFFLYHKKFTLKGNSKGELSKFLACTDKLEEEKEQYIYSPIYYRKQMPVPKPNPSSNVENIQIVKEDYNQINTREKHTIFFVCEYLLTRCKKIHNCQLVDDSEKAPPVPNDFVQFIKKMDEKLVEAFELHQINRKIAASLYNELKQISSSYSLPCPCFPKTFLIMLFIRIRIFYTIRANNREFRKNEGSLLNFSVPKL